MKKILFSSVIALFFALSTFGQSIELIPYVGYTFGGKTPTRYGEIKVKSSESYGGVLNIVMPSDVAVQLEYFRQPTIAEYTERYPNYYFESADMTIDWYQIGGLKQVPVSSQVSPFGGLTLGASNFKIHATDKTYDEWSFSVALQGGLKLYLSDRIGLRFHARLLMPIQWGGFGFYYGSGGGGTTVNAGTYFVQGDVGAGLILRLGN